MRFISRVTKHAIGEDVTFFDTKTQSFLHPEGWAQIYLSGLADGLDENELAKEIASHCSESTSKIADDIRRFLAELGQIDTYKPFAFDNREIFTHARTTGSFKCLAAGVRHCNGATVTIGFSSNELRDAFQCLTFDSLELTEDRECDVYVSGNQQGVVIRAIGRQNPDVFPLYQGLLIAYCTSDDLLAKRLDVLFIAHAGAVGRAGLAALMPALGSSGKSTLVASLGFNGYEAINDDIVPVLNQGSIVSLGTTVKLRQESWPLIQTLYPGIDQLPVINSERDGLMKLVQPASHATDLYDCQMVIVPNFDADAKPRLERITPLEALYKLVESESLFKKPAESETLDRICSWVGAKECYRISYPDTDSGLSLVEEVFTSVSNMLSKPRKNASNRHTGRV